MRAKFVTRTVELLFVILLSAALSTAMTGCTAPSGNAAGIGYKVVWSDQSYSLGGLAGSIGPAGHAITVHQDDVVAIESLDGHPPLTEVAELASSDDQVALPVSDKIYPKGPGKALIYVATSDGGVPGYCNVDASGKCELLALTVLS